MNHTLLTLATAALLLTSCTKKAKDTTINGQVRTYGTEDPIKHTPVKVQIVEKTYSSTWGSGPIYTTQTETWTDQNGNFSLNHKLYEDLEYYIAVDDNTVKESQGYFAPSYGSTDRPERRINHVGGTFNQNYYLVAYGWVRFHFISENPQPGDVYGYNLGGGASEIFYDMVDVNRIWDFGGNIEHEIALNKFRNGTWENWQEKIFVPAFDTLEYEIKFN